MDGNTVYPLKLKPVLEQTVWGGSKLREFRKINDDKDYGISWEVSAHPNATNIITNGHLQGLTLEEAFKNDPLEILGKKVKHTDVLRVSYINAKDNLSVQVHPAVKELEQNEIWYILDAPKDAKVILGLNIDDSESLAVSIASNDVESILETVPVSIGDFIYIPGGLVHALTSGVTVLEVGQNHDNTYRLFDYNRGREVHVNESIEYTKYNVDPIISKIDTVPQDDAVTSLAYSGQDFVIEIVEGHNYTSKSDINKYFVYTNLGDDCELIYNNNSTEFEKGESIIIPATLGDYKILGNLKLLKSYLGGR